MAEIQKHFGNSGHTASANPYHMYSALLSKHGINRQGANALIILLQGRLRFLWHQVCRSPLMLGSFSADVPANPKSLEQCSEGHSMLNLSAKSVGQPLFQPDVAHFVPDDCAWMWAMER